MAYHVVWGGWGFHHCYLFHHCFFFFHGFFLDHVRSQRPGITGQVGAWGEGQIFFGEEAIRLGLADGPVMSLNTLVNQIKNRHNSARKQNFDFAATTAAPQPPRRVKAHPIQGERKEK